MTETMFRATRPALAALAFTVALAACGDERPTAPSLRATPADGARLTAELERDTLYIGSSRRYDATLQDGAGAAVAEPIRWRSLAPAVAAADEDGTVRAIATGEAFVVAQARSHADTVRVIVAPLPVASFASMRLVPGRLSLVPGSRWPLDVSFRDSAGVPLTARAARYRSADRGVATVDAAGTVTAVATGTTWLVASSEGREDSIAVRVGTAPASAFTIDLRFIGTPDERLVEVIRGAARSWERAIVGDIQNQTINVGANACGAGTPALQGSIDDLTVFVQIDSIDGRGGTLGMAGPCLIRSASRIPVLGVVHLDRDDLAWMLDRGTAMSVVRHELGHVLGIGTLWDGASPSLITGSGGDDPRFIGTAAADAAGALGFRVGGGVAVENTGGAGTRDGHWRESVFIDELMTGWASAHSPMSLITIRSLADLGYQVTEFATEPFSSARLHGVQPSSSTRGVRIADVPVRPRFIVDPAGRARKFEGRTTVR